MCVVAEWELGAKTVLETCEKVKIPWRQQGPGEKKSPEKILREDEYFYKKFWEDPRNVRKRAKVVLVWELLDIFHEKRFSWQSDVSRFTSRCRMSL